MDPTDNLLSEFSEPITTDPATGTNNGFYPPDTEVTIDCDNPQGIFHLVTGGVTDKTKPLKLTCTKNHWTKDGMQLKAFMCEWTNNP